jgi:hypothetical protein
MKKCGTILHESYEYRIVKTTLLHNNIIWQFFFMFIFGIVKIMNLKSITFCNCLLFTIYNFTSVWDHRVH